MSYGKIVNNKLIIAGNRIQIENGWITNPTEQDLLANGYKQIVYSEKPEYNIEEEKLVEIYTQTDIITVNYEKVVLTDEEHNNIIKQEIFEEESKITPRRQREFDLQIEGAADFIQQVNDNIIALRVKLR